MEPEIRIPGEEDLDGLVDLDGRAFGSPWTADQFAAVRPTLDLGRFRIAVDAGKVVGVAGSWGVESTLPGGAAVPTGGVTWVAVSVTHRRQGILGRLIAAVHEDIDARSEPLAVLTASEGPIYERFGYGIATWNRRVRIDRRRTAFADAVSPEPGEVRILHGEELVDAITDRWERARSRRPGELSRSDAWHRKLVTERGASTTYAVHADGYAAWKVTPNWNDGHPSHLLELHELVAVTPRAHRVLWHTVLSVDLVGPIVSGCVPMDDPLPYLLVDPRSVRTTDVNDGVWVNVRSIRAVFGARTYGTDDEVVVEADGRRWRIGNGGCARVRARPDLVLEHASVGALVLGGVRPSVLVAGNRATARSSEALRRADALFVTAPQPYCQTAF